MNCTICHAVSAEQLHFSWSTHHCHIPWLTQSPISAGIPADLCPSFQRFPAIIFPWWVVLVAHSSQYYSLSSLSLSDSHKLGYVTFPGHPFMPSTVIGSMTGIMVGTNCHPPGSLLSARNKGYITSAQGSPQEEDGVVYVPRFLGPVTGRDL